MSINIEALIAAARAKHGAWDDAIGDVDLEGLRLFADDAVAGEKSRRDGALSALEWISICVDNAFQLERRIHETPDVVRTPVNAPVFIVGVARTGSTWLQELLSLEPSFRAPNLWELRAPFPPYEPAARARAIASAETMVKLATPAALALHPMSPERPEECHWLLRHNTTRAVFNLAWRYWEWLEALDHAQLLRLFQTYRRHVQVLQAPDPSRRWLGKAPAHALFWPVLFEVFPDAKVIRLHRDPRETLASGCSLIQTLARGADPAAIGELVLAASLDTARRTIRADNGARGAVFDVSYDQLVASPAQTVRRLAEWLDVPSPEALAARVDRHLRSPRRLRAATHACSLDEFGFTADAVSELFEEYVAWARTKLDAAFAR